MFLTYSEVQSSSIQNVVSESPTSPDFQQHIMEAVNRLMPRGDWAGTVVPIHTCVYRGCVVWPRYVDHVRRMASCHGNVPIHGMFYDFLDWRERRWHSARYWDGLGQDCRRNMVNKGWSPVFQDVQGDGRTIRLYNSVAEDIGATVTLYGLDNNNQPLRTRNTDGATWSDGLTLTAQMPYAETPTFVRWIDRVIKSTSQGTLRLYAALGSNLSFQSYLAGYVYNLDTGTWISVTVLGILGSQYLQLGSATPPAGAFQIGSLYNYDTSTWMPVAARGSTQSTYYLDFTSLVTPVNSNYGGQFYNPALQGWQNIVLRGTSPAATYAQLDSGVSSPSTFSGNAILEPIAEYEPSDTNPKFVKSSLYLPCRPVPGAQSANEKPHSIVALVKLKQIPPSAPNDIIVINSLPALKLAVQAIIAGESNEIQTEQEYMAAAVQQLNRELQDWLPDEQIPVDMGELGHAPRIGRQKCF